MKATLKITLVVALLGLAQFADAKPVTLGLSQAVSAITQSGGSATAPTKVVASAVSLNKEGKVTEGIAVAAVAQIVGANSPAVLTAVSSLIKSGADPVQVTSAAVSAGANATAVVNSAVGAGALSNVVVAAAITAGATPPSSAASVAQSPAPAAQSPAPTPGIEGLARAELAKDEHRPKFTPIGTPIPGGRPVSRS